MLSGHLKSNSTTLNNFKQEKMMDNISGARRDFSRIGAALLLMFFLSYALAQLSGFLMIRFFGEAESEPIWIKLLLSSVVQYLIAMPAAYLIIRKMQKQDVEPLGINFGRFMVLFFICYFLMYAGNLLGMGTNFLIQHFTDSTMVSYIDEMLTGTNVFIYGFFVVIAAPVMEELFFRKLLITRMERYGEGPAIIVSGLVFGLFHGNFGQVFYAVALGLVLGYIYIRTRKIFVTIGLHMMINLFGGLIFPYAAASGIGLMMLTGLAALGFTIAGLVMFIIRIKKVRIIHRSTQLSTPGWGQVAFVNFGMMAFFICSAAVFVLNTLDMLIPN